MSTKDKIAELEKRIAELEKKACETKQEFHYHYPPYPPQNPLYYPPLYTGPISQTVYSLGEVTTGNGIGYLRS